MPLIKKNRPEQPKSTTADFNDGAVKTAERLTQKEAKLDAPTEKGEHFTAESPPAQTAAAGAAIVSPPRQIKNQNLINIENILSAGLEDTYKELTPDLKIKFKLEGERVSSVIWQMIESAKIQVQKIVDSIRAWLKIIPGINKFFLEQETKIKTDKIIAFAKKMREK